MSAPAADRKVVTSHVFPPIPLRQFDWCAYFDGDEEGPQGWGGTEDAAIVDLLQTVEEQS